MNEWEGRSLYHRDLHENNVINLLSDKLKIKSQFNINYLFLCYGSACRCSYYKT